MIFLIPVNNIWSYLGNLLSVLFFLTLYPSVSYGNCNDKQAPELYLKGTFNNWKANERHRFNYDCKTDLYTAYLESFGNQYMKISSKDWKTLVLGATTKTQVIVNFEEFQQLTAGGEDIFLKTTGALQLTLNLKTKRIKVSKAKSMPKFPIEDSDLLLSSGKFHQLTQSYKWNTPQKWNTYSITDNNIIFSLNNGSMLKVSFLKSNIVRVRFVKNNNDADISYAIRNRTSFKQFNTEENNSFLSIKSKDLDIQVFKEPLQVHIYDSKHEPVFIGKEYAETLYNGMNMVVQKVKLEKHANFYGLGEKAGLTLNKRGIMYRFWNTDSYGYQKDSDPLYISIPFYIEQKAAKDHDKQQNYSGVLFDNTHQSYINLGKDTFKNEYYFGATDGEINYYVIQGPTIHDIIKEYTELTGRSPMPPKWALGYQQCRFSYQNEKEIYDLLAGFKKHKIPVDVFYLDIHYMDKFRSFTWDKKAFPNLKKMVKDLHKNNIKVISIIDPHIAIDKKYHVYNTGMENCGPDTCFLKRADKSHAKAQVWPGLSVFPDFFRDDVKQWWGDLYKPLALDIGIDGFWNDMNEPATFGGTNTLPLDTMHTELDQKTLTSHRKMHNVYGTSQLAATFDGLNRLRPNRRNFVLGRAGYAGQQRLGAVWTGDNSASWEHMRMNIPMSLNLGMSGFPNNGADIGGFIGAPSPELFLRWMQLGVFFPLYRNHAANDTPRREPWVFGKKILAGSRNAIKLRYRLLQFFYDHMYEAHLTGIPITRPLLMEFPKDPQVYSINSQFILGDNLMAIPVLEPAKTSIAAYFPDDHGTTWYQFESSKSFSGGQNRQIPVDLMSIPIYVKGGSIIPIYPKAGLNSTHQHKEINLEIYPAKKDFEYTYTMYRDSGLGMEYREGKYHLMNIRYQMNQNNVSVEFTKEHEGFTPSESKFVLYFRDFSKPNKVFLDSKEFNDYKFDKLARTLIIEINPQQIKKISILK